jgi:glycosyltransferase involved in cell wall biosynthesis
MRVALVDPPAYTPPYDRSLAAALARAGADVELITSHFMHGPVPDPEGYRVTDAFYRRSTRQVDRRGRQAVKALEHLADMRRLRRQGIDADVAHYQWLTFPGIDAHLLPARRPRVLTPHGWLRREAWHGGPARGLRRLLDRMDAIVALSEYGAAILREESDVPAERVHVIPHGAFDHLTRLPDEAPLPPELEAVDRPVVLCFGLIRPYKGIDVMIEAFREIEDAELWIVGRPLGMSIGDLRERAAGMRGTVRFVERFVSDAELPAFFRRADIVALPYRDAEQSGVLYTALAFGKPVLMTSVGGFPEVAATGAGMLVPPNDARALATALAELLADPDRRGQLAAASAAAAAGPYSWDEIGRRTLALYGELLEAAG